jgi:hypothetical protein
MKILNFILAIIFIVFAFVQINDPDPILWILIYGAMAVLCILAMFNIFPKNVILVLAIVYIAYSLYYIPGVKEWLHQDDKTQLFDNVAKMEHPFIEESREFLGLWICIIVLIFYYMRARKFAR